MCIYSITLCEDRRGTRDGGERRKPTILHAAKTERAGERPCRGDAHGCTEGVRPRGEGETARRCDRGRDGICSATGMRTGRRGWDKTLFLQISPQSPRANLSRVVHGTTSHSLSAITGTRSLTPLSRFRVSDTCWLHLWFATAACAFGT